MTRKFFVAILPLLLASQCWAQMYIRDQSIRYQQERMVFKQWDKNKFTPKPGFLSLNPLYWLTWAWHTNYKNTDRRPLFGTGPQNQRLAMVAAMQSTEHAYRLHADTLRNTAISEAVNYNGLLSDADPLWLLYYSKQFRPLLNSDESSYLTGVSLPVTNYLVNSGVLDWYTEQSRTLAERLNAARSTIMDRGSRILAYHRMLDEYRKINASWETKKQQAAFLLYLRDRANSVKAGNRSFAPAISRSDRQIADDVISRSKL